MLLGDEISTLYLEIFPEFARPAYKPEANTQDFNIKWRKMNYKGKTDPKIYNRISLFI